MKRQWLFILMVIVFASCKKENAFDCFKSNGKLVTQTRTVDSFTVIKVYDKIDLNVFQGNELKVEVNAGEHLLSNIRTRVENGVLTIKNSNKCNFVRGYKKRITVNVTVPYVRKIDNEGVGTLKFSGNQDSLFVRAENSGDIYVSGNFKRLQTSSHGNGDIYLEGNTDTLYVYMFGTNFLRGQGLRTNNYVFVETLSIGDCHINASNLGRLECNIWRSGNIYYTGTPGVINDFSDGTAKGRLIRE